MRQAGKLAPVQYSIASFEDEACGEQVEYKGELGPLVNDQVGPLDMLLARCRYVTRYIQDIVVHNCNIV